MRSNGKPRATRSGWCRRAVGRRRRPPRVSSSSTRPRPARWKGKGNDLERTRTAVGRGRNSTNAALVDTNVLVYRFYPRFPEKQGVAPDLLREGIPADTVRIPHQALVEFVAAVSRPVGGGPPLLAP